jgi:hypothetical protein
LAEVVLVVLHQPTEAKVAIQPLLATHQRVVVTERVTISKAVRAVQEAVRVVALELQAVVTIHRLHLHKDTTAARELTTLQTALAVAVAVAVE